MALKYGAALRISVDDSHLSQGEDSRKKRAARNSIRSLVERNLSSANGLVTRSSSELSIQPMGAVADLDEM